MRPGCAARPESLGFPLFMGGPGCTDAAHLDLTYGQGMEGRVVVDTKTFGATSQWEQRCQPDRSS